MKNLYKYLSSEHFSKIFSDDGLVHLKASYPKDFNDPYELFLTVETKGVSPEVLAYYEEILGNVPQWPTICFSARPDVVPMWAHYARECSGVVIQGDEDALLKAFPECTIENVNYSETPHAIDIEQVSYAYETSKPRHTFRLQRAAFNAAYFTKSTYWSYELERRFVIGDDALRIQDGIATIPFPHDCVTAIIVGPKAEPKVVTKIDEFCKKAGYAFYQMHIGRSSIRSFFVDGLKRSLVFDGNDLVQAENSYLDCDEPLDNDTEEKCHRCAVSESDKANAAIRNPMRRLAQVGLLDDYLNRVSHIERKPIKKSQS